ncbi:MAG: hypothetical protein MHM6MM_005357 [Cercozoa sp. M6MM]
MAEFVRRVDQAADRLADFVINTPVLSVSGLDDVYVKCDQLQSIGSFKVRGVLNWALQLSDEKRQRGLLTNSAGNTAQALAYAARLLNTSAEAIMPVSVPLKKLRCFEQLGGQARKVSMQELFDFMRNDEWNNESKAFCHPWIEPKVHEGHATVIKEVLDVMTPSTVYVPVGGGGLCLGVAQYVKQVAPTCRVIGVQAELCAPMYELFHGTDHQDSSNEKKEKTLCDGIAVPFVDPRNARPFLQYVDGITKVSEHDVKVALLKLLDMGLLVEPSAAVALAAASMEPKETRGKSVVILTGRGIDRSTLTEILREFEH